MLRMEVELDGQEYPVVIASSWDYIAVGNACFAELGVEAIDLHLGN